MIATSPANAPTHQFGHPPMHEPNAASHELSWMTKFERFHGGLVNKLGFETLPLSRFCCLQYARFFSISLCGGWLVTVIRHGVHFLL
jgi:hypothetical protein